MSEEELFQPGRFSRRKFLAAAGGMVAAGGVAAWRARDVKPIFSSSFADSASTISTVPPLPSYAGDSIADYKTRYQRFNDTIDIALNELRIVLEGFKDGGLALQQGVDIRFRSCDGKDECYATLNATPTERIYLTALPATINAYRDLIRARACIDDTTFQAEELIEVPTGGAFIDYIQPKLKLDPSKMELGEQEKSELHLMGQHIYYAICASSGIHPKLSEDDQEEMQKWVRAQRLEEQPSIIFKRNIAFRLKMSDVLDTPSWLPDFTIPATATTVPFTITIEKSPGRERAAATAMIR